MTTTKAKKRGTPKEFWDRNSREGRTARFSLTLDLSHLTDEERRIAGLPQLSELKIRRGTMSAWDVRKILDMLTT